ncbi:MAG: Gfo/Idh/MocA family oxidoreductase [Spirochaetaceae bacterium]|nr:Gfo/Idh/MocA family oxidoreductase [Spirochaetaceae bacterium]
MESRKKHFALVGCGTIARKHVHVIQNYLDNADIIGLCDKDFERAKQFEQSIGVPAFKSIKEMMNAISDDIDIISILTPSGIHFKNVIELVDYGKPLIIEKPIALRLEEADEILHACDSHNVKIFVVHQNRYNAPIIQAREALEKGRLGKLVLGTVRLRWKRDQAYYDEAKWRGTWANDGGVFTNQASHHIDMLTWFMGPVESVKAIGITRLANIECEDTGAAILRFTNGAIGIIEATTATRPHNLEGSISILGEKGSIVIGGFFMNELTTWEFEDEEPGDEDIFERKGKNPENWGYNLGEYLKGVISSVDHNKKGLVDGLEGRKSLELISAIYESIETGKEISLRFQPKRCRLGII